MVTRGLSPREVFVQQLQQDEASEESLELELDALPRWRFRRRLQAERQLRRRRERRARMQVLLQDEGDHS